MIDRRSRRVLLVGAGAARWAVAASRWPLPVKPATTRLSFDLGQFAESACGHPHGSGQLSIKSGTTKFMEGAFAYNVADWKPVVNYR